ncbi:MAG: EpsI family protein, partial [Burkholderiaceae bacterium]|nr:EpsI family protein [Burkholderiaceae bacterium]
SSDQPLVDWAPAFENPSAQVTRTYKSDDREVGLYVGYYRQQDYGRKLVSSSNVLVKTNNHAWVRAEASTRTLKIGENSVTVRATQLRGAGVAGQATQKRLLVWQTYWINGTLTASDHLAKAYGAFYRLLGRGDDAAVIILYVPYEDLASADATLELFARDNLGTLEAQLRAVRDRR